MKDKYFETKCTYKKTLCYSIRLGIFEITLFKCGSFDMVSRLQRGEEHSDKIFKTGYHLGDECGIRPRKRKIYKDVLESY